jgi:hypothetical protein
VTVGWRNPRKKTDRVVGWELIFRQDCHLVDIVMAPI